MSRGQSIWFSLFIEKLKNDFNSPDNLKFDANISHACTAAIIRLNPTYSPNSDLHPFDMLYIRRALKKGDPWSGQIAFPGGIHEGDERLQATAERETMEEIGLDITEATGDYFCCGYCHKMDIVRGKNKALRVINFVFFQCIANTLTLKLQKKEIDAASIMDKFQSIAANSDQRNR